MVFLFLISSNVFFKALQQHTRIMAKEQSAESKTEFAVLPLYKKSTEIRRDFSGQQCQVNIVILDIVPVSGDTVGFEKLLICKLVCFVSHMGLHDMLQFCLLRWRLYQSAASIFLTVSLEAWFRLYILWSLGRPFSGRNCVQPCILAAAFLK